MGEWEAPAKLNLDLRLRPPDATGLHPIRSIFQAVDWLDLLVVEEGDEDALVVEGADLPDDGDNLVWKAVSALGVRPPSAAHRASRRGRRAGRRSSDAAAASYDGRSWDGRGRRSSVGADSRHRRAFLPSGDGTRRVRRGDHAPGAAQRPRWRSRFRHSNGHPEVYKRWDELGSRVRDVKLLPPARRFDELRNDPAAALRPELADWMSDRRRGAASAHVGVGAGMLRILPRPGRGERRHRRGRRAPGGRGGGLAAPGCGEAGMIAAGGWRSRPITLGLSRPGMRTDIPRWGVV